MSTIESPGSVSSYISSHPELDASEAQAQYFQELGAYRHSIAESVGVTEGELHSMSPSTITQRILTEAGVEQA